MIETFSKEEFENALPDRYWTYAGFIQNEHAYLINITDDIKIMIRSSVKSDGYSAEVGKDSIRCWLVNGNLQPLGSKISKWTTRQSGWDQRLLDQLRQLWAMAQSAGYCSDCRVPRGVYVSKTKNNFNRIFSKCKVCNGHFKWMEE